MHRLFLILLFQTAFSTTPTVAQRNIDKPKADQMFKETLPLFDRLLNARVTNKDSAVLLEKEFIQKLEQVYLTDTTNSYVGYYLLQCYKSLGNFHEVIRWSNNQLMHNPKSSERSDFYYLIASVYISLCEFDSSKIYIDKSLELNNESKTTRDSLTFYETKAMISGLIKKAESIYNRTDIALSTQLQLKSITSCKYSLQIVEYLLPYTKLFFNRNERLETEKQISIWQKNCR
ncbi:hypothetical protein [Ferruginibacter profundus]